MQGNGIEKLLTDHFLFKSLAIRRTERAILAGLTRLPPDKILSFGEICHRRRLSKNVFFSMYHNSLEFAFALNKKYIVIFKLE